MRSRTFTLKYYAGKVILPFLKGQSTLNSREPNSKPGGSLSNNPSLWNIYLPGLSTLQGCTPIAKPYAGTSLEQIKRLKRALERSGAEATGGLLADEMEIEHGLRYLDSRAIVIGNGSLTITLSHSPFFFPSFLP